MWPVAHGSIVPCALIFSPACPMLCPLPFAIPYPLPPASAYPSIRLFSNQHSISGCRELKSQANNMTRRPSMNSNRQSNQFCSFTTAAVAAAVAVAAPRLNAARTQIFELTLKTFNIMFFSCINHGNDNNNAPHKPQKCK